MPCLRRTCPHVSACPLPCAMPCAIEMCSKPCPKKLACGHKCPSFCGMKCPSKNFCRQCGDYVETIVDFLEFKMYRDIQDPVYILECNHILTKETYDGIMNKAEMLKCPTCKAAILSPTSSIEKIQKKLHVFLKRGLIEVKRNKNLKLAKELLKIAERDPARQVYEAAVTMIGSKEKLASLGEKYSKHSPFFKKAPLYEKNLIQCYFVIVQCTIQMIADSSNTPDKKKISKLIEFSLTHIKKSILMCKNSANWKCLATAYEQKFNFFRFAYQKCEKFKSDPANRLQLETDLKRLSLFQSIKPQFFPTEYIDKMKSIFEKCSTKLTKDELNSIREALPEMFKTGWGATRIYECPNGHPYFIGDCGGAMQATHCPDCGEPIGGGNHRVVRGNVAATELLQAFNDAARTHNDDESKIQ